MQKQKFLPIRLAGVVGVCIWAVGCASNVGGLAKQRHSHAATLKEESRSANLTGVQKTLADSLVDRSAHEIKDGKNDEGLRHADLAVALYYQAYYQREVESLDKRVDFLQGQVKKDTDQLNTYKEILKEMKGISKP